MAWHDFWGSSRLSLAPGAWPERDEVALLADPGLPDLPHRVARAGVVYLGLGGVERIWRGSPTAEARANLVRGQQRRREREHMGAAREDRSWITPEIEARIEAAVRDRLARMGRA